MGIAERQPQQHQLRPYFFHQRNHAANAVRAQVFVLTNSPDTSFGDSPIQFPAIFRACSDRAFINVRNEDMKMTKQASRSSAVTRREWIGASVVGAGLMST